MRTVVLPGNRKTERRLAVIVAADVVGYSRLMGLDEEGTLERLRAIRREIVDPQIFKHRGRIVKTTGDGILVEFASAVEAVRCAIEVQQRMAANAAAAMESQRILFRIGVNLGDVISEEGDIFGDGVNVAARLESLADPGGIFISASTYDQVRDRISLPFHDLGEKTVKNIARPVRVYSIALDGKEAPVAAQAQPAAFPLKSYRLPAAIAAGCIAVLAVGLGVLWQFLKPAPAEHPTQSAITQQSTATKAATVQSSANSLTAETLAGALSELGDAESKRIGQAYISGTRSKAIATTPNHDKIFFVLDRASATEAQEAALEGCQFVHAQPCALLALNDWFAPGPLNPMPRLAYSGVYDPLQVPSIPQKLRQSSEILNYGALVGPKAAAFHPRGRLFISADKGSQWEAESDALNQCNNDPSRNSRSSPCYLYAVNSDVVLLKRSSIPLTPPPKPATSEALRALIGSPRADELVRNYLGRKLQKGLAVTADRKSSWQTANLGSRTEAEEVTLEKCQMRYGEPCMMVAINTDLVDGSLRSMPRLTYSGPYVAAQVPTVTSAVRAEEGVSGYAARKTPKAMALHPWGKPFISSGLASQYATEEDALRRCNADPERKGQDGPCFLYAVEDRVVLGNRAKEPISPK